MVSTPILVRTVRLSLAGAPRVSVLIETDNTDNNRIAQDGGQPQVSWWMLAEVQPPQLGSDQWALPSPETVIDKSFIRNND